MKAIFKKKIIVQLEELIEKITEDMKYGCEIDYILLDKEEAIKIYDSFEKMSVRWLFASPINCLTHDEKLRKIHNSVYSGIRLKVAGQD